MKNNYLSANPAGMDLKFVNILKYCLVRPRYIGGRTGLYIRSAEKWSSLLFSLLLLLFGCLSANAFPAGSYSMDIRHLSPGPEFEGQAVFSVIKNADGFAWMSTRSVITRYDGREMVHYRLNETELITDADGLQTCLRLGADSSLWAFSDIGKVYRYDLLSDRFILHYDLWWLDSSIRLNDINIPSDGSLWLASTSGVHVISEGSGPQTYLKGVFVNSFTPLDGQRYALNTEEGVVVADWNGELVLGERYLESHSILYSYWDPGPGLLWTGTLTYGLRCLDISEGVEVTGGFSTHVPPAPVRVIRRYDGDKLLVGLDGRGVYIVDTKTMEADVFLDESQYEGHGLSGRGVYDILVDGNRIWVATYTGGVTVASIPEEYELVRHIPYDTNSLLSNHVYSILEDRDGDLWFATDTGISLLRVTEGKWTHFDQDSRNYLTLCEDHNGRIWCGGFNAGVKCIDKRTGSVRWIPSLEGNKPIDWVYSSYCDRDGSVWLGGIFMRLTCITDPGGPDEEMKFYDINGANSIVPIREDSLLINTVSGFYILDKTTGYFRHYFGVPDDYNVKTSGFIYTGAVTGSRLWLGTSGGGLNRFDLETDQARNFSTYDDLPSNFIYCILSDREGDLWISSGNGIFCFDPVTEMVRFSVPDLPVTNFVFSSGTILRDGTIVFGSPRGALFFDPSVVRKGGRRAKLFFTGLRVFYNNIDPEEEPGIISRRLDDVRSVRLAHNRNSFSLGFTAIDLYNPERYLFSYRLRGFEDKWSPEGNTMRAEYTNIPPGRYRFEVMCIDKSSPDATIIRSVQIRIDPPFWATVWAYILYTLIAAAIIRWTVNYNHKRMENRRFDDKIKFFVNVAHDIRTPLSLVMAPLNDLAKEEELGERSAYYLDLARQNGNKLYSLVSRLLDFHKMEVASTSVEYSPLDAVAYLNQKEEEFRPLAVKKGIALTVSTPAEGIFIGTDFDKLNHILDNLISNAIKYTPEGGNVALGLSLKGKKMVFEVTDDGIGIHPGEHRKILRDFYRTRSAAESGVEGTGMGLAIARRLARMMKGRIQVNSALNRGSTFRLVLPYDPVKVSGPIEPTAVQSIEHHQAQPTDKAPEDRSAGRNRILIVEDNDDMRNYLAYSLSPEYRTYAVASASEAIGFLRSNVVDIVISDLMMEGMNGIELCRRLKTSFETSHLFVILLTASTRQENIVTAFEAGADDYITKPFSTDVLRMKVSNLLQTRARIQQHYLATAYSPGIEPPQGTDDLQPETATSQDEDFLRRAVKLVTDNMSNPEFTINELCREMAMSRTLIYEKLRAMVGQSPSEFIRTIRLKHARELLLTGRYSITDVSVMTGFSDTKYFSTVFKKYFGESPGKIIPSKQN